MTALIALWLALAPAFAQDEIKAIDLAIAARDYDEAGDLIAPLLEHRSVDTQAAAWARMGVLYAENDMPYAALLAFEQAASRNPASLATRLDLAFDLAEEVGDEALLEPWFAKVPAALPPDEATRASLFGARHHLRERDFETALALLGSVPTSSPHYADVQHLRGIAYSNQGSYGEALAALLTAEAATRESDDHLHAIVVHNAGRAYYGSRNYLKAVEYLGSVPRESMTWPDAVFERAWAHFAIGDYAGSYSVLRTLETPFFDQWYWAEADLLRVYALFEMCKFPMAREGIATFKAEHEPILSQLDAALGTLDARGAYDDAIAYMEGDASRLPPAVLARFRYEERFQDARSAVAQANRELQLASRKSPPWAQQAMPMLSARRDALIAQEGGRVLARAVITKGQLDEMLDGIEFIQLDIMQYETDLYERAAATGELNFGDQIGKLRELKRRPGIRSWPFQGEYWADEVPYYVVDTRSDCTEDQPR